MHRFGEPYGTEAIGIIKEKYVDVKNKYKQRRN